MKENKVKQFEELHPKAQEAVKELKQFFESIVMENACNVLWYKDKPSRIYNNKISFDDNWTAPFPNPQNHLRGETFPSFIACYTHKYFLDDDHKEIADDCYNFLRQKNYFIKMPKNKIYSNLPGNEYFFIGVSE